MPRGQGDRKTPIGQSTPGGQVDRAPAGDIEINGTPDDYQPPTPIRPLRARGQEFWEWAWRSGTSWLHPIIDREAVQMVADMVDERDLLRARVMSPEDWRDWRDRSQLRMLDKALIAGMGDLGFNPVDRARMMVNPSKTSALDELMQRRQARGSGTAAGS